MKTKTFRKTSIFIVASIFIWLGACDNDERIEFEERPNKLSKPGGAVTSSKAGNVEGNEYTFDIELYIFNRFGVADLNLTDNDLQVIGENSTISIESLEINLGQEDIPYDASIIIDQSGSMESNDPFDLRIEAGKEFAGRLGNGDKVALAAFSDRYQNDIILFGGLTNNGSSFFDDLESLRGNEGGGTPLYFATFEMTNFMEVNATNDRKALIILTDGKDTEGISGGISTVINNANTKGIRLYTVGLSEAVDFDVLADMAGTTGGAFMWARDAPQLLSMFGSLGKLLEGSADTYHTTFKAVRSFGEWRSGERVRGRMQVSMPSGFEFEIPFSVPVP